MAPVAVEDVPVDDVGFVAGRGAKNSNGERCGLVRGLVVSLSLMRAERRVASTCLAML